jgi:exo-beta-1,3-glucanase (GH17 family)
MNLKKILMTGTLIASSLASSFSNAEYKPIYGLCHGPFRQGQDPEYGIFPTLAQVEEDVSLIADVAAANRSYATDQAMREIPRFCWENNIDCYAGSWISDNAVWNQQTAQDLIDIANEGYDTTKGLLVGNEYLLWRPFSSESTLINLINQVQAGTDIPVSASETWHIYRDHPNLANAVDFLAIHIHPYWEGRHIDDAVDHVLEKYNEIKTLYPGKEIVITEVGWPSDGDVFGSAVPSPANQKQFLEEFVAAAKENDIKYFLFEAFDEPWKERFAHVEGHWGIGYVDRTLKPEIEDYVNLHQGDVNKDGNVDVLDVVKLSENWLEDSNLDGPWKHSDINQNGTTDLSDLVEMGVHR